MGAFDDLIPQQKKSNALQAYMARVGGVESNNDPAAINPMSGAAGKFQFIPSTAKQYGIDPLDPMQAQEGMERFTQDNARVLTSRLGREPTPSELYLAHQQGAGGALKLLGNPDAPAESLVGEKAVIQNGGKLGMSAGEFAQHVMGMYDRSPETQITSVTNEYVGSPEIDAAQVNVFEDLIPEENRPKRGSLASLANTFGTLALAPFEQGLQGLTSGFADEALDYPVAGIKSLITGEKFDKTLEKQRGSTLARLAKQREIDPLISGLSDIGGQVAQLAIGGNAIKGTQASKTLAEWAAKNPLKSAMALGAVTGVARGAGEGTDEASRLSNAVLGGGIGAGAGPLGVALGRGVAGAAGATGSALKSFAQALGTKTPAPQSLTAASVADEIFPKTAGQRTQDVKLQRLENDALAGTISPEAERAAQAAMVSQNTAYKGYLSKLGGSLEGGRDVNAIIDDVGKTIQSQAATAKQGVNDAYELAREYSGGVRKGVKIERQDIQKGLWKNIGAVRREGQFDVQEMPLAKKALQRLARYSLAGNKVVSPTHLGELENWRKMVTGFAQDTKGTSQGNFLRRMVSSYDSFMEKTAENAVDVGDAQAINAFKNAVKSRREYGKLFESNKLVEDIVGGEKSVDDVVKNFIGTGSIKGRQEMANNLGAVLTASGKESGKIKTDLQNAFAKRVYEKSRVGFEPGSTDRPLLSPAKLKTELENIFIHQSEFAEKLFGKEAVKDAAKAIRELTIITARQPRTTNPSGSGEWVGRLFKSSLGRIPGLSLVGDILQSAKTAAETQKAIKSISGVNKFAKPDVFAPQSKFWAASSGTMGGTQTRAPLKIEVRPSDTEKEE